MKNAIMIFGVGVLFLLNCSFLYAKENSFKRVAVIGVKNQTKEKEFSDLLIVQGIANLVSQALYDTGRYVPLEDKPEIIKKVAELLERNAQGNDKSQIKRKEIDTIGCHSVAYATVKQFKKRRIRGLLGPLSGSEVKISVEVEVSLRELDGRTLSAIGKGKGKTRSVGALFQIRTDNIHFDETCVGGAINQAVKQAVKELKRT